MKRIITISILSLVYIQLHCQEFETHQNGLIYDTSTVNKLKHIVDSLNLKFKTCEMTETYYTLAQTKALVFRLSSGNIKKAKEDIENGMSLEDLKATYPKAYVSKPALLIAYDDSNYYDEIITTHISTKTIGGSNTVIALDSKIDVTEAYIKDSRIVDYYEGGEYTNENVKALFLLEPFRRRQMKDTYAEMIQYSDCMIDTTSTKMLDTSKLGTSWNDEDGFELYNNKNYSKLSMSEKKNLLYKLRGTKVIGTCSMDSSPRIHALNIAILSAETVNWEVFLKAHLDVMNDRFDRASDGSYAWQRRQTYLKELEVLDINLVDLIFGITFRIDNANKNHYYGTIRRLGRALTESKDEVKFEKLMLQMLKDDELDDYNRSIIYYLYDNYPYSRNNCEDKEEREARFEKVRLRLKEVQQYLPAHLVVAG